MPKSDLTNQTLYSRKDQNDTGHHNFVGNLRYEKTDSSSVSLNRFWRTNFCAFFPGPLKKNLDPKKAKILPGYQTLYSRKDENETAHHNFVGKLRYEKTDASSVSLNRFWRTNFCALFPGPPEKKNWIQKSRNFAWLIRIFL